MASLGLFWSLFVNDADTNGPATDRLSYISCQSRKDNLIVCGAYICMGSQIPLLSGKEGYPAWPFTRYTSHKNTFASGRFSSTSQNIWITQCHTMSHKALMTFSNINTVLNTTHTSAHTLAITDTRGNWGSMSRGVYYKKQTDILTKKNWKQCHRAILTTVRHVIQPKHKPEILLKTTASGINMAKAIRNKQNSHNCSD